MKKIIGISLCLSLLLAGCQTSTEPSSTPTPSLPEKKVQEQTPSEKAEPTYVSPLTGNAVGEKNGQSFAIMIENSPAARPHTGLQQADVVYEIETEAEISRYLAFFRDDIPEAVGPARSSRHYFIPIAEEWNVPYIHFGGSPQAYSYLNHAQVPHIDGITKGKYFWRDKSRKAPHNAYLSPSKLEVFQLEPQNNHFTFGKGVEASAPSVNKISFSYNSFTDIQYIWNAEQHVFLRYQEGKPQTDRNTGKQIYANNVIFQVAAHQGIQGDDKGRIDVKLQHAEGKALYLMEGKKVEGTWKNDGKHTEYQDEKGNLISLLKGKTWIQIVDPSVAIKFE